MLSMYFIIPAICIIFSTWFAIKAVKKGANKKKAVILQICSVAILMGVCLLMPTKSASAATNGTTTASSTTTSESSANASAFGIGLIAAALVTGLSGIGGGIAVASAAPAAIAATSEDPKAFGKALIFVALGEGIALYGLLVSIMIFNQLEKLSLGA